MEEADPRSNNVLEMKCPKQREACRPEPEDRHEVELCLDSEDEEQLEGLTGREEARQRRV